MMEEKSVKIIAGAFLIALFMLGVQATDMQVEQNRHNEKMACIKMHDCKDKK